MLHRLTPQARRSLLACALALLSQSATAAIDESFTGAQLVTPGDWHLVPSGSWTPRLTAADPAQAPFDADGQGWLRLTNAGFNQNGLVKLVGADQQVPPSAGLLFEFDYVTWGSTRSGGNFGGPGRGADGISFFLYDAAQDMGQAQFGGGLGYCQGAGAYLGIGLDEWGNFAGPHSQTSNQCGTSGAPAFTGLAEFNSHQTPYSHRNTVTVRGPQSAGGNTFVASAAAPFPISQTPVTASGNPGIPDDAAERPPATAVRLLMAPKSNGVGYRISVLAQREDPANPQPPAWQVVLDDVDFPYAPPPGGLRLGLAASTGVENNIHEVRRVRGAALANLQVSKQLPNPDVVQGETLSYQLRFSNQGLGTQLAPNNMAIPAPRLDSMAQAGLRLRDDFAATNQSVLSQLKWTCSVSHAGQGGATRCPGGALAGTGTGPLDVGDGSGFVFDGADAELSFTVTAVLESVAPGLPIDNTASAAFDTASPFVDADLSNNSASASVVPRHLVQFESNGGTPVDTQRVVYDDVAAEPTAPQNSGYVFMGWFADAALQQPWSFAQAIEQDTVLFAKWEIVPPVTVDFGVSGNLVGLASGQQVVVGLNNGAGLTLTADGGFAFADRLTDQATYLVEVQQQPQTQVCSVERGGGSIAQADVTDVLVRCQGAVASTPQPIPANTTWSLALLGLLLAGGGLAMLRRR